MPPIQPASPANVSDKGADRVRGKLMQASLKSLLDQVRGARDALPHLAALERALLAQGPAAVDAMPHAMLARIYSQLSSLPLPQDDLPLQDLVSRMKEALARERAPAPSRPPALWAEDPDLDMTRTVVIQEISHSEFMAVADLQDSPGPST